MMNVTPKISNDSESARLQRNMTDTQKRNSNYVKEGKIVNAFVKDPQLSLDETVNTLVISRDKVELPEKVFEQEKKKNRGLYYLTAASVGVMGALGIFTAMIKNFSKKRYQSTEEYLLPGITRNHCINNEIHQSIFSMIQSPNRRTILASIGVITLASMAFIAKNVIDGFKDVWVKSQEANIQKNLQERLIAVETQSFSGKMQIIRSMLSEKAGYFSEAIKSNPNFKSKKQMDGSNSKENSNALLAVGAVALAMIFGLGYLSLKNLKKSDILIKKGIKNTEEALSNLIKEFNKGTGINDVKDHEGNILKGKDAYKHVIENMLESIYARPEDIKKYVDKMNLPSAEKEEYIKHLTSSMNQATEKVNSAIGGSGRNKITYFSHVNDYLSFFYDWLMNPKNPQFRNLFIGITGVSAMGYCGKAGTEAIKDVEVKKYNADIELDLQKRLVSTELRNFKAKKESVIQPLCDEFDKQKENGKAPEELKVLADNILFEIKNGPPFVYS